MNIELKVAWSFNGPLHVGTGLSRPGVADRTFRVDAEGRPYIPGDAVKGAIRGAAERITRWLIEGVEDEAEDHSTPKHPALRRLFLPPRQGSGFYRFFPAIYRDGGSPASISTTAINRETGIAKDETLRTIENWSGGSRFEVTIRGLGGDWESVGSEDYKDLPLLTAAIVSADFVGGGKATGHGACQVQPLPGGVAIAELCSEAAMERLQRWLREMR